MTKLPVPMTALPEPPEVITIGRALLRCLCITVSGILLSLHPRCMQDTVSGRVSARSHLHSPQPSHLSLELQA